MIAQYQKNLTKDINTTMALYPGYVDKNVKKEEEVGLDAGCWTRWPPPVPSNLFDSVIKKSSETQLKVKEHFSVFSIDIKEILH